MAIGIRFDHRGQRGIGAGQFPDHLEIVQEMVQADECRSWTIKHKLLFLVMMMKNFSALACSRL
jgi:hypothetical protein